jgi:hypothetical protein
VNCALSVLRSAAAPNGARQPAIRLRIGINLGDVLIEGDDIYGDGVNIAAPGAVRRVRFADPELDCPSLIPLFAGNPGLRYRGCFP